MLYESCAVSFAMVGMGFMCKMDGRFLGIIMDKSGVQILNIVRWELRNLL